MIIIYTGSRADYSIAYNVNRELNELGIESYIESVVPECDYVILIGDRKEVALKAIEATYSQIPIIHIGGGEVSLGSYDDTYRAMITQASKIHFVINYECANRLISQGVDIKYIYVVGSPRIDYNIEIEPEVFTKVTGLCIYHPETKLDQKNKAELLFNAMAETGHEYIVIHPNEDRGSDHIVDVLKNYPFHTFNILEIKKYLSVLKGVDYMIGNSSAGIMETPIFKKPNILVGYRQEGREIYPNTIQVGYNKEKIKSAIQNALEPGFQEQIEAMDQPFDGLASKRIAEVIKGRKNG